MFTNKNVWSSTRISLNIAPRVPIKNKLVLVQIMVWRRPGDRPLSEPMMVSLLAHICVARSQWIRFHWSLFPKVRIKDISALVQIMASRWTGDKPLSETKMVSVLRHICVTRFPEGPSKLNKTYQTLIPCVFVNGQKQRKCTTLLFAKFLKFVYWTYAAHNHSYRFNGGKIECTWYWEIASRSEFTICWEYTVQYR